MKKTIAMTALLIAMPAFADSCLQKEKLIALDQQYETAVQQAI